MGIDTSIYQNLLRPPKSVHDYDQENLLAEKGQQEVQIGRMKMDEYSRGLKADEEQRAAVRRMGPDPMANLREAYGTGNIGFVNGIQKTALEASESQAKNRAQGTLADKHVSETQGLQLNQQIQRHEAHARVLPAINNVQEAVQWIETGVQSGALPPELASHAPQIIARLQQDPAFLQQWKVGAQAGATKLSDQFAQKAREQELAQKADAFGETARHNRTTEGLTALGQNLVDRRARETAQVSLSKPFEVTAPDGTPMLVQQTKQGAIQPVQGYSPKKAQAGGGKGGLSATLQKELIESDDMVDSAKSTIGTLRQALKVNEAAYSGYGAKTRALIRSNLPGSSPGADSTIELDNLIGSQALSGMKAIFGGNPTEGERAILLDLQASSSKTPAQRKVIIERGIAAAEKRQGLSASRAESIRSGSYLSSGPGAPTGKPASSALDDALAAYGKD